MFSTSLAAAPLVPFLVGVLAAAASPAKPGKERPMSLYDLNAATIDLKPQPLAAYKGRVVLVVNTASECGFTPQYEGLEQLHQGLKDKGFAVLGFPSNEFGGQEPGSEAEIKKFCSLKYNITFPMFAKVKTKGDDKSPIYGFLTAKHGEPKWNFHKYLVGKQGQVIKAYPSKTTPNDPGLRADIEAALAEAP
ncbi:MAG TPA: glutathione peroxidase [Polyangia bacterium]